MLKKILAIIIIVVTLVGVCGLLYYDFTSHSHEEEGEEASELQEFIDELIHYVIHIIVCLIFCSVAHNTMHKFIDWIKSLLGITPKELDECHGKQSK